MIPSCFLRCAAELNATVFPMSLVGNAAFHSSELYSELSLCIPPLSAALLLPAAAHPQPPHAGSDAEQWAADEKTRANAAGAVGNLIRLNNNNNLMYFYGIDSFRHFFCSL